MAFLIFLVALAAVGFFTCLHASEIIKEVQDGTSQKIDIIVIAAVCFVSLGCLIWYFSRAEYSGQIQFQRIANGKTGEPLSILSSLIVYIFFGCICGCLYSTFVAVVIVEPIVAVYVCIKKVRTAPHEAPPVFFVGMHASFLAGECTFAIAWLCHMFGVAMLSEF